MLRFRATHTPPLNIPALGRHQPLYCGFWPWQRPVFLVNSRLSLLPAAPSRLSYSVTLFLATPSLLWRDRQPVLRDTLTGRPFSRSYGANLPSSLTEDRSSTSGEFPLPTGVGVRYGPWVENTSSPGAFAPRAGSGFS